MVDDKDVDPVLPAAAGELRALLHDDTDLAVWATQLHEPTAVELDVRLQVLAENLRALERTLLVAGDQSLPVSLHLRAWAVAVGATVRQLSAHLAAASPTERRAAAVPAWLQRYRDDPIGAARDGIDLVAGDLLTER